MISAMVHVKGASERKGSWRAELVSLQTSGGGGNGIYWSVPWESATCSPVSLWEEGISYGVGRASARGGGGTHMVRFRQDTPMRLPGW